MRPLRTDRARRRLYLLIAFALMLSVGHHIDHAIRGNHVGWPLTPSVNGFTYSLAIYPAIGLGLLLDRAGRAGPGFWAFLSGGGLVFLAAVHFGPQAIEPPRDIIELYQPPVLGWLAFGWLLLLIGVLFLTFLYELRLWRAARHVRFGRR